MFSSEEVLKVIFKELFWYFTSYVTGNFKECVVWISSTKILDTEGKYLRARKYP